MAAYRRVYDSRHLQADCQEPGSAPEPYARQSSMRYLYFFYLLHAPEFSSKPAARRCCCYRRDRQTDGHPTVTQTTCTAYYAGSVNSTLLSVLQQLNFRSRQIHFIWAGRCPPQKLWLLLKGSGSPHNICLLYTSPSPRD